MRQTAVEWLFERFIDLNADMKYSVIAWEEYLSKRADLLDQAKAMEKEQKAKEYMKGYNDAKNFNTLMTKTFKSE